MPITKEEGRIRVEKLVETFKHNLKQYQKLSYKEAQVRKEFIDKLFVALGWDVNNDEGRAEQYKEVINEDAVRVGGKTKAPDYAFRIGGTRVFFVEAKKPAVDIKGNSEPAFQLRRYAWNLKIPLSILTDFQELAIYDCRIKPAEKDSPAVGRIAYFKFEDYLEEFDKVWDIFSKEAVLKGSFDKYVEDAKGKRGTSEVDAEFLKEIEEWRSMLAKNIALRNPDLGVNSLNFVVQRTIDRIIFLRNCEDRGIERYGRLQDLLEKEGIYAEVKKIYEEADEKYNSGLFHFREEKGQTSPPDSISFSVKIDDKILKDIIKRTYYPTCPYEFSVLPVDILGHVYEQFLGKVIRLTKSHRAVIEEKPEVKKAGGVYYTPEYIVNYIVENTVGKLIKGKTPKQISSIKLLDPACGSGSFLIRAYSFLLDYHLDWYLKDSPMKHKNEIYEGKGKQWYLTTQEKKRILLNNIFGVDIDRQAVEVTKLNLLLKVLENENQDRLTFQKKLFHERVLPDLGDNIKCGNSLIGTEIYLSKGESLTEQDIYRINAFDWKREFPKIQTQNGFDAIIGNPPYIRIQSMKEWAPHEVEFYKDKYESAKKGNYDIYVVFVEKALDLLNPTGVMGFIMPHKFFQSKYGQPLRKIIADGKNLREIVHFGDKQVFKNATTYTCLLFLRKGAGKKFRFVKVLDLEAWKTNKECEEGKLPLSDVGEEEWNFHLGAKGEILGKLEGVPSRLKDVAESIYQGLITGADPVFILIARKGGKYFSYATKQEHALEQELMHPLCKGSVNIRKYHVKNIEKAILFPYKSVDGKAMLIPQDELSKQYPHIWEYLKTNRDILEARERGKWKNNRWYAFGRTQNLNRMEIEKILTPSIANSASYTLDPKGEYYFVGSGGGGGGGYGITLKKGIGIGYNYLLGLLNSNLLDFYLKAFSTQFSGGYYAYNRQYIENLPIKMIDPSKNSEKAAHDQIVLLVNQILKLKKQMDMTATPDEKTRLERQVGGADEKINQLVYQLYGISKEEKKLIEDSLG